MQEFTTVSSSSYDPSALAAKLNDKSAEGWSVVSIVSTGGDVTAFLQPDEATRPSHGAADPVAAAPTRRPRRPRHVDASASSRAGRRVRADGAERADNAGRAEPSRAGRLGRRPRAGRRPSSRPSPSRVDRERIDRPAGADVERDDPVEPSPRRRLPPPRSDAPSAAAAPADRADAAVPAGWYADPAGRFELRYWDGGTWTEHVSRAGQQFTDPPVA